MTTIGLSDLNFSRHFFPPASPSLTARDKALADFEAAVEIDP
jgi:hypothetical protein